MTGTDLMRPGLIYFVLACADVQAQDVGPQLADRLEQATPEERVSILMASPEALSAAYKILTSRASDDYNAAQYDKVLTLSRINIEIADALKDPKLKIAPYKITGQSLRSLSKNAEALEPLRQGLAIGQQQRQSGAGIFPRTNRPVPSSARACGRSQT